MQRSNSALLLSVAVAIGSWSVTAAGGTSTFEQMIPHYENIRQALLHDGMDGVADAADRIQDLAQALAADFSEEAAGVGPEGADELRALLPSIREASVQLSEARTVEGAREAFGALSKDLVRYRRLVGDPAPAVAFCSMAQQVWLQPTGEIGNPYYGQSMARCGEFVSQ